MYLTYVRRAMWSISEIKKLDGYRATLVVKNTSGETRTVVGNVPCVFCVRYDMNMNQINDTEYRIRSIHNIETESITQHSVIPFMRYIKAQRRLKRTVHDLCVQVVKDPKLIQVPVLHQQLESRENKDLHLCYVAMPRCRLDDHLIEVAAKQIREYPDTLCVRDRFECPYAFAFYHTTWDVARVQRYLHAPVVTPDEANKITRRLEQVKKGATYKTPEEKEGMFQRPSGLWDFTMDETRYQTFRERLLEATIKVGDVNTSCVDQATHIVVPHLDDVKNTILKTSVSVRPVVYHQGMRWGIEDTVCIVHAERFRALDWAKLCNSLSKGTYLHIVGRFDTKPKSFFARFIHDVGNKFTYVPITLPKKVVVWSKSLNECIDKCIDEFGKHNVQIFGASRGSFRGRVWMSTPRRIRTIKLKTDTLTSFWEADEQECRSSWVGDCASAIQPSQWPGGTVKCAIVLTSECKYNAQFVESICTDCVYYVDSVPLRITI